VSSSLIDTGEREASLLQQRFGNHTLIRQIGQGGYSNVYLGVHSYLNIEVALKLLDLCRASDDEKKRFQFEARIHAQLRHSHIVRVLDFGWGKSTPFMVMEYAPGGTLQKFFPPQVPLPLRAIMPAVLQIASALKYVHDHGLIHCDVKPENMLLGPGKEVWLADFGIACPITAAGSTQFSANKLVGTPLYLAPEQISGNPLPASDQYALAVMVYIWLCGQVPFRGTSLQVCLQHLSASPPRLREHVPSISPAVEQIVLKALAKDPKQRFAQVQEFAHALRQESQVESVTMLTRTMTQAP
jgi:serine/threonine protein kinase